MTNRIQHAIAQSKDGKAAAAAGRQQAAKTIARQQIATTRQQAAEQAAANRIKVARQHVARQQAESAADSPAAAEYQAGRQQRAAANNKAAAFANLILARQAVEQAAYRPTMAWSTEQAAAAAAEWDFCRIAAAAWLERAEIVYKAAIAWEKIVNVL